MCEQGVRVGKDEADSAKCNPGVCPSEFAAVALKRQGKGEGFVFPRVPEVFPLS